MKRVLIGISGGVDSSVAAALLKDDGYEVIGLTFVFTDEFDLFDNYSRKSSPKSAIMHS